MTGLTALGFPLDAVRHRAVHGTAAIFPDPRSYGSAVYGQSRSEADALDRMRLVPPVLMPRRLDKLVELGREPTYRDVDLATDVGGFRSAAPVYVSALGSSSVAEPVALELSRQAGAFGIPLVIGENLTARGRYERLMSRIETYTAACPEGLGGVVVQQSTEDADSELWNRLYSDPLVSTLLARGRLGFELKVGQGAKPGLGGMTLLSVADRAELEGRFLLEEVAADLLLRSATPGTFTEAILRGQIRMMRNNFPRARTWVKFPPGRDVAVAARLAWECGADAVTVDGAEAGTGWALSAFLDHVGLPLAECLARTRPGEDCLLASGRMWQGHRAVKSLALGARAVGIGRAAVAAVDAAPEDGLTSLLDCLGLEMRMLISALGKYRPGQLDRDDIWMREPYAAPDPLTGSEHD
ncbi:glutamate synthase-related protein [Streptomyces albidoflavus]